MRTPVKLVVMGGGAPEFSPADLSPILWLRADTGLYQDTGGTTPSAADGDPVGLWQDQSGNGYHVSQGTAANQPKLKLGVNGINGRATVLFDGSPDILVNSTANWRSSDGAGSVFIVYRMGALANYAQLFSSSTIMATSYYFDISTYLDGTNKNCYVTQRNNDTQDAVRGSTVTAINTTYLLVVRSSGTAYTIRRNGADETLTVFAGGNNGDWLADTTTRTNFSVGAKLDTAIRYPITGSIAEVIMFSTNVIGSDLTNLENYMNNRYGAF